MARLQTNIQALWPPRFRQRGRTAKKWRIHTVWMTKARVPQKFWISANLNRRRTHGRWTPRCSQFPIPRKLRHRCRGLRWLSKTQMSSTKSWRGLASVCSPIRILALDTIARRIELARRAQAEVHSETLPAPSWKSPKSRWSLAHPKQMRTNKQPRYSGKTIRMPRMNIELRMEDFKHIPNLWSNTQRPIWTLILNNRIMSTYKSIDFSSCMGSWTPVSMKAPIFVTDQLLLQIQRASSSTQSHQRKCLHSL